ncbi:TadE/TadG family type IV pilus assembly protein [Desulfofundulus salinus]|uniref:Pilus assembly protein n=1 Tax=Desulfofundulus salinus TaxID=2419843 RepID=A0A494WTX1_9FIRM|nr:TadE family protein [Desulfofundulus salinum]RKO66401.1 pilus assembly protein [Desulfofundulus salinum]
MSFRKDSRGSVSIEALFIVAVLLMLFFFIVEMGFLMYDWAVVNHAASAAAVEAAMNGRFSADIRQATAEHIRKMTTEGSTMGIDALETSLPGSVNPGTIYVYGTDPNSNVQRGGKIAVGVAYPFRFKTFLFDALGRWLIGENQIVLKAGMTAASEVYFEQ